MKNHVVVITGASSGIGKALAEEFGKHGSKILITARRKELLQSVAEDLRKRGITVHAVVGDSGLEADNRKIVDEAISVFGQIDVLINNAGLSMRALFEDLQLDVFRKVMDVNFYGTVYATKFALPYILKMRGSIIGISSINGRRATPGRSAYSASKYAMEGFLESVRTEVMKRGVHVLTVCPGFTASNIRQAALTADGSQQRESPRSEEKMMTAEEAAEKIYRAFLSKKRDLILTRQGKLAVFLNKWMPGRMDKIVYDVMAKEPDSPLK